MSTNGKKTSLITRQEFLRVSGAVVGAGIIYFLQIREARAAGVLPPGAGDPDAFFAACLHCGRCAAVCDRSAIQMNLEGTPTITGIQGWCDFCGLCVDACPTQALEQFEQDKEVLGLAVIDKDRCIAWSWTGCRLCYEKCQDLQQAVWVDEDFRPFIDEEKCNGCGACVYVCPQSAKAGVNRKNGKAVMLQPKLGEI